MNQFKKAKQKALESGHQVENITDLKTAGTKQEEAVEKVIEEPEQESEKEIIIPQVITETPAVQESIPVEQPASIIEESIIEEPVIEKAVEESPIMQQPVYKEVTVVPEVKPMPTPAPVVEHIPAPTPVHTTAPSFVREETVYAAHVEAPVVSIPKTPSVKKSVPNIFAPKNEAKSMRKSLVLKPTSVKIAENYCAKNGGSFNELIQTLLDNFIDEYGL